MSGFFLKKKKFECKASHFSCRSPAYMCTVRGCEVVAGAVLLV